MTFRVGQKVVFIGPDLSGNVNVLRYMITVPRPNGVYTIRQFAQRHNGPGYLLAEIVNKPIDCLYDGMTEVAINAEWLRPLVERKTDISFAHEILRKATKPAPATSVALQQR